MAYLQYGVGNIPAANAAVEQYIRQGSPIVQGMANEFRWIIEDANEGVPLPQVQALLTDTYANELRRPELLAVAARMRGHLQRERREEHMRTMDERRHPADAAPAFNAQLDAEGNIDQ